MASFLDSVKTTIANRNNAPTAPRQPAAAPRAPQADIPEGQLVGYRNTGNHTRFLASFNLLKGLVVGKDERQRYVVQMEGGHVFHLYANAVTGEWQLANLNSEERLTRFNEMSEQYDAELENQKMDLSTAFSLIAANAPRNVVTDARRVRDALHILIPQVRAGTPEAQQAAEPEEASAAFAF